MAFGRKGQSWSTDLILGVVVFLLIITIFYSFTNRDKLPRNDILQKQGEQIVLGMDTSTGNEKYPVIQNGIIDEEELVTVYNTTYDELRNNFGVQDKFCIFLEDQDGKIIIVENKTGTGSNELRVSGTPCGQAIV